jgi:hypothetical protein
LDIKTISDMPKAGLRRTARYYRSHPLARKKKKEYDTKYHRSPERRKYRSRLGSMRVKRGLKGDGRDLSHNKDGSMSLESKSTNRARNGANGKSSKK